MVSSVPEFASAYRCVPTLNNEIGDLEAREKRVSRIVSESFVCQREEEFPEYFLKFLFKVNKL